MLSSNLEQKTRHMSGSTDKSLPNLIKDIIFYYVKFYYDKFITELSVNKLTEEQINDFVELHYTNKEKDIRDYVRKSLKKNLGDEYNSFTTENILLELFSDASMAKERLRLEINDYQENHLNT